MTRFCNVSTQKIKKSATGNKKIKNNNKQKIYT